MISRTVVFGIVMTGLCPVLSDGVSYSQSQRQRSLQPEITQTQHALSQVSDILQENQTDLAKLMNDVLIEFSSESPLQDAVDVFNVGSNGFHAATAYQNGDYLEAIGQSAEAVAAIWGKANPWGGGRR